MRATTAFLGKLQNTHHSHIASGEFVAHPFRHKPKTLHSYVMWYPFEKDGKPVAGMENVRYRYSLKFAGAGSTASTSSNAEPVFTPQDHHVRC